MIPLLTVGDIDRMLAVATSVALCDALLDLRNGERTYAKATS